MKRRIREASSNDRSLSLGRGLGRGSARPSIALALAGGGPFGAIYEIGALLALEESLEGLDLNRLDCYVGVSAGSILAAALANGIPVAQMYRLFIAGDKGEDAVSPRLFTRPALREYIRAAAGLRVPTGLFDNRSIDAYLAAAFTRPGRTNDFRRLRRRLYVVATDLDRGSSVTFGRPGYDDVPISKAVQASAALPGLFPPVEIGGRHFVDGALKKTLHASEALSDGVKLVLCVNPLVPYDAGRAARPAHLAEGGLPAVLSQAFRALIHSRMEIGIARYKTQYRGSDVVLFEPDADDGEVFFTSVFSYATRQRVCELAYERTRRDLRRRRAHLEPLLARHGLRLRREILEDPRRDLRVRRKALGAAQEMRMTAFELRDILADLRYSLARV